MVSRIERIGLPSAVQQALLSIGMMFVIGIVNGFGENATAAFGAATRVEQSILVPAMVLGMAISTLAGQNLGANKPARLRDVFLWGSLVSGGVTLRSHRGIEELARLLIPHEQF
jgi:Na+-driven multidrug efflux pump